MGFRFGKMGLCMKESGLMIKQMGEEDSFILMETVTMESG
jgi:hypothetical protein